MKKKEKDKKAGFSIGKAILGIKPIKRLVFSDKNTLDYIKAINPRDDYEKSLLGIWEKRIGLVFVLFVGIIFLFIICYNEKEKEGYLTGRNTLTRAEDDEEIEIFVGGKTGEDNWEEKVDLNLESRHFSENELAELDKKTDAYLGDKLLGENSSTEHITNNLCFVKQIPETKVELNWTYDNNVLSDTGELIKDAIPDSGVDTDVMVKAVWKNFEKTYHYMLHLDPPRFSEKERAMRIATVAVSGAVTDQAEKKVVDLPAQYQYREEKEGKNYTPVFAGIIVLVILPFLWREQGKKKMKEREEQMLLDHPGFINKVMLLLGAGLTIRGAFERMSNEYEKKKEDDKNTRYIYEELCITVREMKDGVSETKAIESFGKRVRCMPYMRFASIISQNLKKGADGILNLLEKEAADSLEERKQTALRLGEIAGTKLLFPMIIMLGLVMGIIMVPAFMSM